MSHIARLRNANRKMLSFDSIFENHRRKSWIFKLAEKNQAEDNNTKQGFIAQEPPKDRAFYRKVGKMA